MDKYSFETFARPKQTFEKYDPNNGPARSDLLALQYADYVAKLLEGRGTGSRVTREASDSALAAGGAFVAAQETLGIAASSVAGMGVGAVILREMQGIFNARGRSEAFTDAAYLIRQAQAEYRAFNPNPSASQMTENGATLVRRVDSALHAARKTLNGRMPALLDLQQATQPMSTRGAVKTSAGPTNYLATATGNVPLPAGVTREDVQAAVAAEVAKMPKQESGRGGMVKPQSVKQSDFQKRAGVQTLALKSLEDAQVQVVYEEVHPAGTLLPGETERSVIHADLIKIKAMQGTKDGTMPPDTVRLLEKYETAIKNQVP